MSLQYTCLNLLYVIKQSIHNGNAFILMFLIIYRWYSTNCLCKMNFFINFLIIIKEIIFLFDSYDGRGGIWTIWCLLVWNIKRYQLRYKTLVKKQSIWNMTFLLKLSCFGNKWRNVQQKIFFFILNYLH